MTQKPGGLLFRNSVFVWIAIATAVVLLIPLAAMQITSEVNWNQADFIVMGSLLFGMASLFVLAARKVPGHRRTQVGMVFLALFIFIWAEFAVGIFTNLGS